eukprot:jgi/Chlat1/6165/Chrsp41S09032
MPLRLDIKRKLAQRSDRVKSVDIHPTEPWVLANLYNGNIYIWNHQTQTLVKSFEVTELPVRSAKFIPRKQWIVCGADDMFIRVYNYNTMDKVKAFEAHTDYIRCVAVHPTLPYVVSSSDDMLIKLWDWDKNWQCVQIFEGHSHYVMQVTFNPKDTNTFASASLDRTIKVWSLGSPTPNFTLEGHEKGVNTIDYFSGGDRPYLVSGADDKLVKVWDYQTKSCVQTLEGHTHNVSAVCFHPELPIIITGSEDGTLRIWHSTTYRLENTLNYGLERVWAIGYLKGSNRVAIGYDEGTIVIKIGREEPVASMDASGKIIWAKHSEIQTVNVRSVTAEMEDGERLQLAVKELGSCDLYPQSLKHNPNGRFVTVCGDGEYIIYTALAWRNKSFGAALEFVWSSDAAEFAVRESTTKIKVFKNFQERKSMRPHYSADGIYGGAFLGVRSNDFVCFYDWAGCRLVRRIDVPVKDVFWSDSGDLVAITSDTSFYILKYNREIVEPALENAETFGEDGIESAFDLLHEVSERVRTGLWVGDCFIYNNSAWRLNYCVGGEVTTMYHLDRPMYLLGYLANQSRLYLIDKEFSVISYTLLLSLIEYKTLILRGDNAAAEQILPTIPKEQMNSVARFLETRGMLEEALAIATDPDFKFDLAIQMGKLDIAQQIANEVDSETKWKQLGELAMSAGKLDVAEECLARASDLSGLLLMYSATGNAEGMTRLAELAKKQGKQNVGFLAVFLLGKLDECVNLLIETNRIPEAAFFARTYIPSRMSEVGTAMSSSCSHQSNTHVVFNVLQVVALWRNDLKKVNQKAAESLADPAEYPNLFPDLSWALRAEDVFRKQREEGFPPASEFPETRGRTSIDVIEQIKELSLEEANGHVDGDADEEQEQEHGLKQSGEMFEDAEESVAEADPIQHSHASPTTASSQHMDDGGQVGTVEDDAADSTFADELEKELLGGTVPPVDELEDDWGMDAEPGAGEEEET